MQSMAAPLCSRHPPLQGSAAHRHATHHPGFREVKNPFSISGFRMPPAARKPQRTTETVSTHMISQAPFPVSSRVMELIHGFIPGRSTCTR